MMSEFLSLILPEVRKQERKRNAAKLDQQAKEIAKDWCRFLEWSDGSGELAEFARAYDKTVPLEFDDYWDHPKYQACLFYLARAGAQPAIREKPVKKVRRGTVRKKSAKSSTRKPERKKKV